MVLITGILIGLVGSLHCATMCGPLVMALNYNQKSFGKNVLYHSGRVISYMLLGALLGLLSEGFAMAGVQQVISVLAGLIIIGVTVLPKLKVSYFQNKLQNTVLAPMKRRLLKAVNGSSSTTLFSLGFLNGLLPCGMVYAAIAASMATSGWLQSVLLMLGFGLGSWPLLLSVAMGSRWISKKIKKPGFNYVLPAFTMLIGALLIVRGLELNIPYLSPVLTLVTGTDAITTCQTP